LRGQVSHRPFGISQAQPATGGQPARVHALLKAVADLPGGALGEREQQRAEVLGGAGQVNGKTLLPTSLSALEIAAVLSLVVNTVRTQMRHPYEGRAAVHAVWPRIRPIAAGERSTP
jgi:hypothetical protein